MVSASYYIASEGRSYCNNGLITFRTRNGLSGELLRQTSPSALLPLKYRSRRVRRTRLQSALLKRVPEGIIQLNKRLVSLENLEGNGVHLFFEDKTSATADLVIGADGIRSVRQFLTLINQRVILS